jgi:hypothetical protein
MNYHLSIYTSAHNDQLVVLETSNSQWRFFPNMKYTLCTKFLLIKLWLLNTLLRMNWSI